jgi:hypothetical protein
MEHPRSTSSEFGKHKHSGPNSDDNVSNPTHAVSVYKGIGLKRGTEISLEPKHFVFDLDETLGSFSDLYTLFQCIDKMQTEYAINLYPDAASFIHETLDACPEFFRYGIEIVLEYLYKQKEVGLCGGVYIYTNNVCLPDSWTSCITNYIEHKWKLHGLFDTIIRAFKIDGRIIEPNRTTHEKTHTDLLRCLLLPEKTEFCFIDNTMHPKMKHRYVCYLQPKPYYHVLSQSEIFARVASSKTGILLNDRIGKLEIRMRDWYVNSGRSIDHSVRQIYDVEIDLKVSKSLMKYIHKVFHMYMRHPYTQRNRTPSHHTTQKLRN